MKTAFVVLGMHRSGTSSVAGTLALLGAAAPRTLMGPKPDNPRGFWESEVLMTFNDEILARAGSSWDDAEALDGSVFAGGEGASLRERAARHLAEEFGEAETIVLKDPRICRFYPFWREVLAACDYRPLVVMPIRRPEAVAASLHARNAMPIAHGLALWRRHVLDAERDTRGQPRHILMMEDFIADWRAQVQALSRTFGLPAPPSDAIAAEIDGFLNRDENDRRSGILHQPDAGTAQVYNELLAQTKNG